MNHKSNHRHRGEEALRNEQRNSFANANNGENGGKKGGLDDSQESRCSEQNGEGEVEERVNRATVNRMEGEYNCSEKEFSPLS